MLPFKPKTSLDLCMAMHTKAEVEIENKYGRIVCIKRSKSSMCDYIVTLLDDNDDEEDVFFNE